MNILSVIFFFISLTASADFSASDQQGHETQYVVLSKDADLREVKKIFLLAFIDNFSDIPLGELPTLIQFMEPKYKTVGHALRSIEADFNEDVRLLRLGQATCISAIQLEQTVGFACFQKDPFHPTGVFVRSLVVDPAFQRQGIGQQLLFAVRDDSSLVPDVNVIFLITSAGYRKSIAFYKKQGFLESPGLCTKCDPLRHVVLAWHKE